jgi:peptidoglycan L-alanyl-D-glutamate endopeptidase CwlK
MRDSISLDRCNLLHPKIREEAILAIENAEAKFPANIKIRVVQGLRTIAEQDALFNQRPKVTKAKGGQSFHNYGLAIDFALMYDKDNNGTFEELSWDSAKDLDKDGVADWNEVVNQFEILGWDWGGKWRTFKDLPHLQKTFGYTWQKLFAKHQVKDFISGTQYVNI